MSRSKFAGTFRGIRWILILIGVGIFLCFLPFFRGRTQPWTLSNPALGSPFIYKGPEAQDKVVVMAKMVNQTVDWA